MPTVPFCPEALPVALLAGQLGVLSLITFLLFHR